MGKCVMYIMGMDSTKYGGIERYNVLLAHELSTRGFHGVFLYESRPVNDQFCVDLKAAGGELVICNSRHSKVRFCIELLKHLAHYRPMLLHAHFTKARFYALPIAYLCGIKKIFFTHHGEVGDKHDMKPWTRMWNQWAGQVAQVIAVSDSIRREIIKNWPKSKVETIYLGVKDMRQDCEACRKRIGETNDKIILLCVANFNHIKGLDVLCKALGLLKNNLHLAPETRLYLVGQPQRDIDELALLVSTIGIDDYVVMTGIRNDVETYMNAADIYIQPSRSEGIGLTLMEAASVGLPLIGTHTGGIPEVIHDGENGILVEKGNESALAEAIATLISEENLRKLYGLQSRNIYTSNFNIDNCIQKLLSLYNLDSAK